MTKEINTVIDDNLKLLATLCLLKEVADKHIYINDKIFRISQQIFSDKGTVFRVYDNCLTNDLAAHETLEIADRISDGMLMKMTTEYHRVHNIKPYQYKAMNGMEGTTEFQVIISDKGFTRIDSELYNQMFEGKNKDKLFSALSNVVIHYFSDVDPSLCILSPGSKVFFCSKLDISKIPELKYIIEPFARTCSFSLALRDKAKEFILNDKDIEVVNYLTCLKEYPIYLINAIIDMVNSDEFKQLRDAAHEKVIVHEQLKEAPDPIALSEQIDKVDKAFTSARNEYLIYLLYRLQDDLPHSLKAILPKRKKLDLPDWLKDLISQKKDKRWRGITHSSIQKAAYFFIMVNITFSGALKSINADLIDDLTDNLENMFPRMLSAAGVLQRAKICHHDFAYIMKKYGALDDALFMLDPPYITDRGFDDRTYGMSFDYKMIKDMAKLAQSFSHVIVTHKTLKSNCVKELFPVSDGYSITDYKNKYCKNNSYTTDVFYKGISADAFPEKYFHRN